MSKHDVATDPNPGTNPYGIHGPLRPGDILGNNCNKYEIKEHIGSGGFSYVYKASDEDFKFVAIKEFFPGKKEHVKGAREMNISEVAKRIRDGSVVPATDDLKEDFEENLKKFKQESDFLKDYSSEHIVRWLQFFYANGTAYIVMDYVQGMDICWAFKRLDQESFIEKVLDPLLATLDILHKDGIFHGDLKPSNMQVRENGTFSPVILDFGTARMITKDVDDLTVFISSGYSAIEAYFKEKIASHVGAWTDIYSLAMMIYRCLRDRDYKPIDAQVRFAETAARAADPLEPAISIKNTGCTTAFLQAIDSGLQIQPQLRPQTIDEWRIQFTTGVPKIRLNFDVKNPSLKILEIQERRILDEYLATNNHLVEMKWVGKSWGNIISKYRIIAENETQGCDLVRSKHANNWATVIREKTPDETREPRQSEIVGLFISGKNLLVHDRSAKDSYWLRNLVKKGIDKSKAWEGDAYSTPAIGQISSATREKLLAEPGTTIFDETEGKVYLIGGGGEFGSSSAKDGVAKGDLPYRAHVVMAIKFNEISEEDAVEFDRILTDPLSACAWRDGQFVFDNAEKFIPSIREALPVVLYLMGETGLQKNLLVNRGLLSPDSPAQPGE
jgi:serine/threonine protein kinase